MNFKDHFSAAAADYARYRPGYPEALPEFLAETAPGRDCAWDCATGTGQAAVMLASHFRRVIATDASAEQVARARPCPGVTYRVAPAEAPELPEGSADLITVAQALHWLDHDRFYVQVRRVLRPGGVVAAWAYTLARVRDAAAAPVNEVIQSFYEEMSPWWPPERAHVESGYRDLPFPFEPVAAPAFQMHARWPMERLLGYFSTWSAVLRCRRDTGRNPLGPLAVRLETAWGEPSRPQDIRWPVALRIGRVA
ncbi:MAG: class I SAM-dependent methyltransferase [Gammaproteobacteria bacterium]